MSTADYIITESKNGSRVHRATCKRAKDAVALNDVTPAQAKGAVPASCCKPNAEQVGRALLALSVEHGAEQEGESPADEVTVAVAYDGNGLPKGLWKPLATDAAERLAEATGVHVKAIRAVRTVELTGPSDQVAEAEQVIRQWWEKAYVAFQDWKKTDEYRAMRREVPNKEAWQREQAWLGALDID